MPLPSPATSLHTNNHLEQALPAKIPEQILQREQLDDARRVGSSTVPKVFLIDRGERDGGLDDGSSAQGGKIIYEIERATGTLGGN